MNTIDTVVLILSNLDVFEIIKYSSINKLFYKASNNQNIWMKILTRDFCYNGIFSLNCTKNITAYPSKVITYQNMNVVPQ